MKKKNQLVYERWKDHLNHTKERTYYSIKRMDILIISICGGGMYVIFETLREFKTGKVDLDNNLLLLFSGIFFLLSILSNFLSQITGGKANEFEETYSNLELNSLEGKEINKFEQELIDRKINRYNFYTEFFNYFSITIMFLGLIMLAIYYCYLF